MTDPAAPDLAIVERLRNAPLGLHCTHDAVEVCPEAAQCIEMLVEALEIVTRAAEIVDETIIEHGFGRSENLTACAEIGRAALAKVRGR